MKRITLACACLLMSVGPWPRAATLDLPHRRPSAPGGAEFARSVAGLSLKGREERVLAEVLAGNVPPFLRTLAPVTVSNGGTEATYHVTPDYLAVGSDDDYFLTPLSPGTVQTIADRLDCTLPTPRMVDQIYAHADVRLTPSPIPPSPAMTTVPVFLRHNETVRAQLAGQGGAPGRLVAGHKKDVVIAGRVFATPGKVAIYGWHRPDGEPIQPLYTGHSASWVDYSHGVRLVSRRLTVGGAPKSFDEVVADPELAPLLSGEGVLTRTRYPPTDALKASQISPSPPFGGGIEGGLEPAPALRGETPSSSPLVRGRVKFDALQAAPGEAYDEFRLEPGVRVVINRPEDAAGPKPVLLVLYALPNGNTVEQTVGRAVRPGDDWHLDIQQIGAQTRFLRERLKDRSLVVAYLENDLKSWPAWRKAHGDDGLPAIVQALTARFDRPDTRLVLSGHSGGGSFTFGYLNRVGAIPDHIERIAFLDSNYAYESARHRDKLTDWLKASDSHWLSVLAYNDAEALLNGKPFVSASGGTWGRSRLMLNDLSAAFPIATTVTDGLEKSNALGGRVTFLLKQNPGHEILHTVQVERNGFIESLLSGTPLEGVGYTYLGARAYSKFIRAD